MRLQMTREFLLRRIDRCYLIAAGHRRPEKRTLHLELARHYRKILNALIEYPVMARALPA
ncbi:hypothetical protein [Novosphingobium sp. 9U]|uniref:hypothetical protein n=1 Tax=Novosphingobium sp. 9U TaxID=2653158 RepID=UPI0012F23245|nr:hypothetical protein [Novosphingobium sp. 9U]VWX54835.1 conserved hypothetical protein [Novosphingobium sp. 9U]